uniref:type VI secretion system Vgr family protein n=1 Tax=Myxococcus sp. AB025B TaxID=2562794 RepID=UPI0011446672
MSDLPSAVSVTASIPGQRGDLVVHALRGEEEVSRRFVFELDLSATELAPEEARGGFAHVVLEDAFGQVREVSGVVDRVDVVATDDPAQLVRYRLTLVPQPWLVAYRYGFRIFQELSVPDIVKAVFKDAGLEDKLFRWSLEGAYPRREYCVQYDESEWDFVCRLLEEEGIWFAFEHSADGHVMVLSDASESAEVMEPDALPFRYDASLGGDAVAVWDWRSGVRASVSKVSLDDYDMLHPSKKLAADQLAEDSVQAEWYEYPGRYTQPADGKRLAKRRLEELRGRRKSARARTNAMTLAPGRRVSLVGHPFADGEYFITASRLHLRFHGQQEPGPLVDTGAAHCEVDFDVVPSAQVFRPRRETPRPRIQGLQTARVTGPSGQELHCDEHGRVKVQFHWDRDGMLDDKSSCWVRVTQAHTTGSVMIPRIGWEVLIEFVEGDPDRPVCLGRLYNPLNPPDYSLPAQKTVSGHRSNSSPGAGGSNEVSFDDSADSQRVYVNGAYDINIKAANDKSAKVAVNQKRTIGTNREMSVGANEKMAVKGIHNASVGKDHKVTVGANRAVKVSGIIGEEITGAVTLKVGGLENMQVGDPAEGLLESIETLALEGAIALAGKAASRAEAALLGPLMPGLNAAREALGTAAELAGPAAALLGGDNTAVAVFGSEVGQLAEDGNLSLSTVMASGMAQAVSSGALTRGGASPQGGGASPRGGGAGGQGFG